MNDITEPLRLAIGSHEAGSGKGCAMNVVSWENGDTVITDYPRCSATPLAKLVQQVNDTICLHAEYDFLCPECSLTVLELGHATAGTAGATREQEAAWTAELFDSPVWGCARGAEGVTRTRIRHVANLFRERAAGNEPSSKEWAAAAKLAGKSAAYSNSAFSAGKNAAASAAASASSAASYTADSDFAYRAVSYLGSYCTDYGAQLETARQAIAAWHRICGTVPAQPEARVTAEAVGKMLAK